MIITLTTDFGLSDPFVGIMKGVILGIAPEAQIVDITHDIHAYDITEAAFIVNSSYAYFPDGTIHVVVIDPGVGSARRPIAAFAKDQCFVAPDNGVLSFVLHHQPSDPIPSVYHIRNKSLFQNPVSHTFHGRDIFAPTAAHLSRGTPIESVGERIVDFINKPLPKARPRGENRLLATVLRIDRFGNLITNLRRSDLHSDFIIRIAGLDVTRLCHSFAEADPGEFFAFEGSTGYIEIALDQGSAAARLSVKRGAEIEVETGSPNQ
jgi:S-adenosyl-L-methionine hydrolase (adenosine-forming)